MSDYPNRLNRLNQANTGDSSASNFTNSSKKFKGRSKNKTSRNDGDLSNYVFGKTQPQAVPLEEAVLGAIMLDKDAMEIAMKNLIVDSFYKEAHQLIYRAMLRLFVKTAPIDLLTVTEEVKQAGELERIGGPYYIVELTNRVASAANIEYHSRLIAQKAIQRQLIKISTNIIREAYEDTTDVLDLFDKADVELLKIREGFKKGRIKTNLEISQALMKDIEKTLKSNGEITGIPIFGIKKLDDILNGGEEDDFMLIAGRPGMGKSSLGNSIIINAVEKDIPMAFWSVEMNPKKTYARAISALSGVPYKRILRGQATTEEQVLIMNAIERLNNSKVIIRNDHINIYEFRSEVISMKRKFDIQAVVFDRMGLISKSRPGLKDFDHISEISPLMRATANELEIPIIAMSQLSRDVEKRGGAKRPQLSDLRNSGSLEQDATKVVFCYRPEYYGIEEDEDGNSLIGKGELIVAKNSNGETGTVKVNFKAKNALYTEEETTEIVVVSSLEGNDDDLPF